MSGIIPVENITNSLDPKKDVKLIFDFTQSTSAGNQANKVNEGLEEVGRVLNLHIAAGVKKEKLRVVIIFHSGSILSILSDEYYQKTYQSNNPNQDIIHQLSTAGVQMVICGQSLALRNISHKEVIPIVQVAMSAKTTLSKYGAAGYYYFSIKQE